MHNATYHREILHGRPPSSVAIGPQSIRLYEEYTTLTCHMVYFLAPTEVVGYHMTADYGSGDPEAQLPLDAAHGRFWLMTSNTDNFLPYRYVPNSDTARNQINSGTGLPDFQVRLDWVSNHWTAPETFIPNLDYAFDVMLVNPARIDVPGLYWIAFLYQSYGGGELHSSIVTGAQNGMKDLHYTGSTPTNTQGVLYDHWSSQPDKLPERLNYTNVEAFNSEFYPNITISLITQQLTPQVPYGG
ncbi:MAG TPA: hypothetical protein PKA27_09805 [Fimbriimonadaceae bacterium]|nr:hypothetical protein [Fimbriimonadaceae bacterium]